MRNLKCILLFIFAFKATFVFAVDHEFSLRKCAILPITDTAGNALGYKVYEELERRIRMDGWCDYQMNSDVIEILSKYRNTLDTHLDDPNVIRTISQRLKVGTLIRVSMKYGVDEVTIELKVLGEDGIDVYLEEKAVVSDLDVNIIVTTINNWLDLYENSIPYDGRVIGVLGEQVTFEVPKSKKIIPGQDLTFKRFLTKKRHPLLKKIVEWDQLPIAKGKVLSRSRGMGLGVIKVYLSKRKLVVGDWVKFEKVEVSKMSDKKYYKEYDEEDFGKLGELTLGLSLGAQTVTTNPDGADAIKLGGMLFGFNIEAEAWVTREFFALGEFSRNLGNLKSTEGSPSSDNSGQSSGIFRVGGGYKYLPMGFFYGPQVNLYGGWASYSYKLDKSSADGFGENSIQGFFVGAGGNIPLQKDIRIFGSGEIMPFGTFEDDSGVFGSNDSVSSINLKIGGQYQWSPKVKLSAAFNVLSNSAKFSGANSEITYRDSMLKFGGVFNF